MLEYFTGYDDTSRFISLRQLFSRQSQGKKLLKEGGGGQYTCYCSYGHQIDTCFPFYRRNVICGNVKFVDGETSSSYRTLNSKKRNR